MGDTNGHAAANIIGGIIGGVSGAALGIVIAKQLGLTGWKQWALVSAATVGGAVLGAILGPYIARLAKPMGSAIKTATKIGTELCFVAGTPVKTDKGNVPIEKIKAGDYVYAENPETGEKGLKRVLKTFENEISELVHVSANGEEIVTTPGHPFYVFDKGWVGADKLEIGDLLVLYNEKQVEVEKVALEHLDEPVKVYNLEVEDFHTYYVGDSLILVHNKGCGFTKYSAKQLSKMVKGNFHGVNGVKNAILKDVPANILKQVGRNPDIALAKDGTIQLVSTIKKGVSIVTELNIKWY
ncbi:polymorphic toxin-type HINT domain-containing protein [Anaerobium acetethylicum]|uniref:Intein C-terminal splicing region/intein N-terminal splicing region n=1 Tax=Anaerobium acetethylicum TaxID=1619234 RepID=A0A1D3TYV8_9FIRM|nr:polymorphic toxin-type HINT domain-containing protein [Anaerobium acetethylicum]SCP99679.1 intein C-terminal splicing region/intein N-terminal splicing region [Anaerobium acetethylicum]